MWPGATCRVSYFAFIVENNSINKYNRKLETCKKDTVQKVLKAFECISINILIK